MRIATGAEQFSRLALRGLEKILYKFVGGRMMETIDANVIRDGKGTCTDDKV